jgi:hypothetical protein
VEVRSFQATFARRLVVRGFAMVVMIVVVRGGKTVA